MRASHANVERMVQVETVGSGVILMHGVSWDTYQQLDTDRGDNKKWPRLAYLDGELEIMSPVGFAHELRKKMLARLLEMYALERDIELNGFGNTTFADRAHECGLEPDECYYIGECDPTKEPPHLAIEVSFTSGGVDKLEIYRRLGAREVWFWIHNQIDVYSLARNSYQKRLASKVLPDLDLADLSVRVAKADFDKQTQAVRAYRESLRRAR